MSTRNLVAILVLLICASAHAARVEYSSSRKWVEKQCVTNTTPHNERIFVGRFSSPKYAAILSFHKGITLREIIDQTPFKGKVVHVLVLRAESRFSKQHIRVGRSEKPVYEIKAQDMVMLYDDGRIIEI